LFVCPDETNDFVTYVENDVVLTENVWQRAKKTRGVDYLYSFEPMEGWHVVEYSRYSREILHKSKGTVQLVEGTSALAPFGELPDLDEKCLSDWTAVRPRSKSF
jgi:hypothetical protein